MRFSALLRLACGLRVTDPTSGCWAANRRILSEATLGIYLYHAFFQMAAKPRSEAWPPLALAALGLLGASAVCLAGRRLLGPSVRLLLGA